MAGMPYLLDSNILLRWVKPDHNDYPLVVSAIEAILRRDGEICYTSQNVGEFWNTCTRPSTATATLCPLKKQTGGRNSLKKSSDCFPTAWRCMKSGGNYLARMGCLAFRSTMHGWPLRCEYMALSGF
jgi:hypothetical protein